MNICWLSGGISSLIAGVLCEKVDEWIYIDIDDQHPDTLRFIHDFEKEYNVKVTILTSPYKNVENCVKAFNGFKNPYSHFAPCTNYLKKRVRKEWEEQHRDCDITYIWGFDYNETDRARRLIESNPQAKHLFPLIEKKITKEEAHGIFYKMFTFPRPKMYDLGYPNNNCIGCVKGGMGYWNRIRVDFPEVFLRRAKLEREIGYSILKDKKGAVYLDELEPTRGNMDMEIFPECGIMCLVYMGEGSNTRINY